MTPSTQARTELPLPRFVSLKASEAHVRRGPGLHYPILWTYVRSRIPLEIYQEFGNWRRIRGADAKTGWIYGALLSGERTATVAPWMTRAVPLHSGRSSQSGLVARLEPGVLLQDLSCDGTWCSVALTRHDMSGYIEQSSLWGVYPGEKLKNYAHNACPRCANGLACA
ncbi:SH3 domain-containing protein [Aurantimonas sp. VKM B-3413]|uniref:SH3 domain-containing protein n=1 Tax=Aurantimonas sp. VKM B-3413 TaxID=2779401 RepID=UPI00351D28CF|nr:hypothetical protein [Aurantimonas sp. VKM B-3413]